MGVTWLKILVTALAAVAAGWLVFTRERKGHRWDDSDISEHAPEPREPGDPRNAHLSGRIVHEGRPVASASLRATVHPTGMAWTIDSATSAPDGTFELEITSGDLSEHQHEIDIEVTASAMRGYRVVLASAGSVVRDLTIEVGRGVTIRGRVVDETGAPPTDSGGNVSVCFGATCVRADDKGVFAMTGYELGLLRFGVDGLSLSAVAPRFDIAHLSGEIDGVVLHVDGAAPRRRDEPPYAYEVDDRAVEANVVPVRGAVVPESIGCWVVGGGRPVTVANNHATIPTTRSGRERTLVCESWSFERVVITIPQSNRIVDVPLVRSAIDAIDLGAELRAGPTGARVVDVADEAKAAGLQRDDIVTAIDGISIAGMHTRTVRALGFRLPPGDATTWTVRRGTAELTLHAVAPAAHR